MVGLVAHKIGEVAMAGRELKDLELPLDPKKRCQSDRIELLASPRGFCAFVIHHLTFKPC